MSILGYDFYSDADSINMMYPKRTRYERVTVGGAKIDNLFFENGQAEYTDYGHEEWQEDDILNADFNGWLLGGDIKYTVETLTSMRLKKRRAGESEWVTVYEQMINVASDLNFTYIDKYASGNETEYEYAIVPVVDDVEQSINIVKCNSEFDGAFITDGVTTYHIIMEPSVTSFDRIKNCSVVTTMGSKYPYVFFDGTANYDSGSFSGVGIEYIEETSRFDVRGGTQYRKKFVDWLTNGTAKILKMFDGRIWMMSLSGNVTVSYSDHYDKMYVSFPFVEVGNVESSNDMFNNNFINCNIEKS